MVNLLLYRRMTTLFPSAASHQFLAHRPSCREINLIFRGVDIRY